MASAYGEGSPSGGIHGDCVKAIRTYFQQRTCRACSQPYSPEGIEFLRQEPGVIVVRVGCAYCGHPLGIALVGMNTPAPEPSTCSHGRPAPPTKASRRHPEWTKRDARRLCDKPPISYDDVLNAHEFFEKLEGDWMKHLPDEIRIRMMR